MLNFVKKYKGHLIFTVIFFLMIYFVPFSDYIERNLTLDDLEKPEIVKNYIDPYVGTINFYDGLGEEITMTSPMIYLEKGSYEMTFHITSDKEGNYIQVLNPLGINGDNTSGVLLHQADILPGEDMVQFTLEVTEPIQPLEFSIVYQDKGNFTFTSIHMMSELGIYNDPAIFACLFLLCSLLFLWYRTKRDVSGVTLTVLSLAAIWSCLPLGFTWILNGHDLYFHYGRLYNLMQSLEEGSFPLRIYANMHNGFGHIPSVFYPELLLTPAAFLGTLGVSLMGCYKFLIFSINFVTVLLGYFSFSKLTRSKNIGLIATVIYTLSTYRLINLYTRAAVGESIAMAVLPLLLYSMYELVLGNYKKWPLATLSFTLLFQSHMITTQLALYYSILFALIFILQFKNIKRLAHCFLAAFTTLLLNVWFLVPMLHYMQYDIFAFTDKRNLAAYSLYFNQIFDVSVTNAGSDAISRGTISGEMPLSLGITILIGVLIFLISWFQSKERESFSMKLGMFCLAFGGIAIYASSMYFPWERIQQYELLNFLIGSLQFAFRFLPMATIFLTITSAIGIYTLVHSEELKQLLFLGIFVIALASSGLYLSNYCNQSETYVSDYAQYDMSQSTDTMYLIIPSGTDWSYRRLLAQSSSFIPSQGVTLTDCSKDGTTATFTYEKQEGTTDAFVEVSLNYYPNYKVYDSNGTELSTSLGDLIRLRITLPENASGTVTTSYELPFFYSIGDYISLVTGVAFIGYCIFVKRKNKI